MRPTWDLASSLQTSRLGLAPGRGWPFHAWRVLVLVLPEEVSQVPGIVTVPLFLPFVGRTDVGRRALPAAVLDGVRTFLPDAKIGATAWPARRLPPPVRNTP